MLPDESNFRVPVFLMVPVILGEPVLLGITEFGKIEPIVENKQNWINILMKNLKNNFLKCLFDFNLNFVILKNKKRKETKIFNFISREKHEI